MTQLEVVDHNGTAATSPYGKTVSPVTAAELAALVEQLTAAGAPYPSDLSDAGRPVAGAVSISFLLTTRDGVRVALDVHVPPLAPGEQIPTCLRSTRYRRSTTGSPLKEHLEALEVQRWLSEGFALVLVDVRGTGASFGTWKRAWDDEQRDDLVEILDWIVDQPWSDGSVGGYGTSYDGSAAHLLAATGHPAVRAVVPRFALYDSYADVAAPGGVPLDHFLENWAAMNWALDGHPDRATVPLPLPVAGTVHPVDNDPDLRLLAAAQACHVDNWDLWDDMRHLEERQDLGSEPDLGNGTPLARIGELRKARVPMWLWSSWYDGAYAASQLRQLADPELDVRVTIGPFAHGASMSPLGDPLSPHRPNIPMQEQISQIASYLRRNLTGQGSDPSPSALRYYRLGDGWHESPHWPPSDVQLVRHRLAGSGRWNVDHDASTGSSGTRWHCLIGGGPVDYADRRSEDARRLVWEGPLLSAPLGITGTPVVHLEVISSTSDAALHVYLEAELPGGKVLYLTEGLLRAGHRHVATATRTTSITEESGKVQPLGVGVPEALRWELLPISVLLPAGSRVRVALAGADAALFRRIPAGGDVELEVLGSSWLDLPEQSSTRAGQDVAFDFLLLANDRPHKSAR